MNISTHTRKTIAVEHDPQTKYTTELHFGILTQGMLKFFSLTFMFYFSRR